jgi:hypothetical protein
LLWHAEQGGALAVDLDDESCRIGFDGRVDVNDVGRVPEYRFELPSELLLFRGTSAIFTDAPNSRPIAVSSSRTLRAISWLDRLRSCLSTRLTWMSPVLLSLRR